MMSDVLVETREERREASADGRVASLVAVPAPPVEARRWTASFTVADGLMLLIALLAAVARFVNLGAQPLSPAEADAALTSWQFARGVPLTAVPDSPAYFTFTSLIMSLGGDGDAAARLAPAVFGLLTVLLPWLWRGRFRPAVWLTASALLAVSPIQMIVSRTAGGEAIALFALVLLAVAAARLGEGERWGMAAGAALGLGLNSAPLFYTGLLAFVPAWWVFGSFEEMDRVRVRAAALSAGVVFLAVAAGGLFYPQGLGGALGLLPAWLGQFGLAGGAATLNPLLTLLRYEPALLVLGLPAAIWAFRRDAAAGRQMALWLGLLLLVLLLQSSAPQQAAAALAPGYLLIGLLAGNLLAEALRHSERQRVWLVGGGLALLGMTLLISMGRFTKLGLWTGAQASLVGLAVMAFVFAGIAVVFALAWENSAARRGAFLGVILLLFYWQWGTGWHLSQQAANDPGERWVTVGTDDDVPRLMNLLGRVSRQAANSNTDLEIFSTVDSPVLRWYFRHFGRFMTGATLPVDAAAAVVVTPDDAQPQLPSDYFGADFGLEQHEVADAPLFTAGGGAALAETLNAWLFHKSTTPLVQQRVVVWLRSDLATAE